jgi:hypothetical protein
MNGWLGEVQGLEVSLKAAKRKLTSLDRSIERNSRTGCPFTGYRELASADGGHRR